MLFLKNKYPCKSLTCCKSAENFKFSATNSTQGTRTKLMMSFFPRFSPPWRTERREKLNSILRLTILEVNTITEICSSEI